MIETYCCVEERAYAPCCPPSSAKWTTRGTVKGVGRALGDCSKACFSLLPAQSELPGHIDNTMNDERHTGKKTTTPNSPIELTFFELSSRARALCTA
eukprot:scaffold55557_cov68-Phaeocystis_antarctica.AAC.1